MDGTAPCADAAPGRRKTIFDVDPVRPVMQLWNIWV